MKNKAIIKNREYAFLEILPSLDGGPAQILCEDGDGNRAICSEALWRANELNDKCSKCSAPLHTHSSTQDKIKFFLALFKGREDVYARRYYSTKPGRVVIRPYAGMNGSLVCVIKRNTGVLVVQTVPLRR